MNHLFWRGLNSTPLNQPYLWSMSVAAGQYQDPWQYVDDIWLMFNNAWLYNRKTSRVYKYCSKLAEVFEQEIDPVMQSLGYCCGRKVGLEVFETHNLCCHCVCIQRKFVWEQYKTGTVNWNVVMVHIPPFFANKWSYCLVWGGMFLKPCYVFVHQLEFSPQTLCCYGKQLCTIPRDAAYFSYQNR